MKRNTKRDITFISPYLVSVKTYLVAMLLLTLAQICMVNEYGGQSPIEVGLWGVVYATLASLTLALFMLPIGLLSRLIGPRCTLTSSALIFGVLTLTEISLTCYVSHNGTLMGAEILSRPLSETLMAIKGAVGVTLPVIGALIVIALYIGISHWVWHSRKQTKGDAVLLLSILASVLLLSGVDRLYESYLPKSIKSQQAIKPKTLYFLQESWRHLTDKEKELETIAFDPQVIAELLTLDGFPKPIDSTYPLEHLDTVADPITGYFNPTSENPHLVVIVVESLGLEYMGRGFMPFLDSLSRSSLFWNNCISTTNRSFGAIPAITGSHIGPKGFQFGTMPDHNSLFSTLQSAGYLTQSFYSGYYTFDCIYEYLSAQHVDSLISYFDEYKSAEDKETLGTPWGYHDATLFERAFETISKAGPKPQMNLITTLTMHEDLNLKDSSHIQQLYRQVENAAAKLPAEEQDLILNRLKRRYAGACYTDGCLRQFFSNMSNLPQYKNTIFIVTGDHASGVSASNPLHFHRVPLIIWSPMLTSPRQIQAPVTHLDIAPSISRLLRRAYNLPLSDTVAWFGQGLDFSTGDKCQRRLLIVDNNRTLRQMLCGPYFYESRTANGKEMLYTVGADLTLTPCENSEILEQCRRQIELYRYLYRYTYHSNKITQHPVFPQSQQKHISTIRRKGSIYCDVPDVKPSEGRNKQYTIIPYTLLQHIDGYTTASITLEADVTITENLETNEYADLVFLFENDKSIWAGDKTAKFLTAETPQKDSTYRLTITKQFTLNPKEKNRIKLYLATTEDDSRWKPGRQMIFDNIQVSIYYR